MTEGEEDGGGCLYWRGEGRGRLSGGAGMPLEVWIIFMALVVAAVVVLPHLCRGLRILPPTGPNLYALRGLREREPSPRGALARPGSNVPTRRLARTEREEAGLCWWVWCCPKCDGKGRLRR